MTIETLALELDKLGFDLLAGRVRDGFYSRPREQNDDAVNHLLYDLGLAAGHGLDMGLAIRTVDLANDIIEGKFDVAKDEAVEVPGPKSIDTIWAAMIVEANGQEQFCRFLNSPLTTPDEAKLPEVRKIAEMLAINSGEDVEIVKFTRTAVIERIKGKP